jgi:pimeloyl-ACP methyl ester carboxylesterase
MAGKASKTLMADGLSIAFQEWGTGLFTSFFYLFKNLGGSKKLLALHGWMDNSNSFSFLGPYLAERDYHVAAIDLLGHGHSSHVPKGHQGHFQKYVYHSKGLVNHLGWEKMDIIGHSMSSGVTVMLAGAFPELFQKIVLIDILGPLSFPADRSPKHLRTAFLAEDKYYAKGNKPAKIYENLDAAITARVGTVSTYPGNQTLSREAAHQLLLR